MRVLVAGANGALGVPLTRLLVARGHSVLGLIRNPAGTEGVRALGANRWSRTRSIVMTCSAL